MKTEASPDLHLNFWSAEFRSPDMEAVYRHDRRPASIRQVRIICLLIIAYILSMQVFDLVFDGIEDHFWRLLGIRVAVAMIFGLLCAFTFTLVNFTAIEVMISVSHASFLAGLALMAYIEPGHSLAVLFDTTIFSLAIFIIMPSRFFWSVIVSLLGSILVFYVVAHYSAIPFFDVMHFLVLALIAQALGAAGCYRIKVFRRFDFLQMSQARQANTVLRSEVDKSTKNEEDARRSADAFRQLFHVAPVPLALVDSETYRCIQVNRAFARLIRANDETVADIDTFEIFKNTEFADRVHQQIIEYGMLDGWEMTLERLDSRQVPVLLSCFFMMFEGRGSVMVALTDISDQLEAQKKLEFLASTDPLTGLANRRHFMDRSQEVVVHAKRYFRPVSFIILDIDHFKSINDTYGHDLGDRVLVEVSQAINKQLRGPDLMGRLGGEEFMIVLPESHISDALLVAERARKTVESLSIHIAAEAVSVTVSCGVGEMEINLEDLEGVIKRCDKALYEAKDTGRNRVIQARSLKSQ